jgi:hypothetical protein
MRSCEARTLVAMPRSKGSQKGRHAFIIDLRAHTTYSGIFDSSVTTVDVEKGIAGDPESSSEEDGSTETSGNALW